MLHCSQVKETMLVLFYLYHGLSMHFDNGLDVHLGSLPQ